jgi:hypothetical protein
MKMEPFGALWAEVVEANPLKNMVGPWGLEPQTSTVSKKLLGDSAAVTVMFDRLVHTRARHPCQ